MRDAPGREHAALWPRRVGLRGVGARTTAFAVLASIVCRTAVLVWGAPRFGPAADGEYFHLLAQRLADGHGYTWAWPDGVVTYAAHYPVGYPAILALMLRIFGAHLGAEMLPSVLAGAAGTWALSRLLRQTCWPRAARLAVWAFALHPALVLYVPALMTDGIAASMTPVVIWCAWRASCAPADRVMQGARIVLGLLLGLMILVRPQWVLLAPPLGALSAWGPARAGVLARGRVRRVLAASMLVSALALLVCAPWTVRNCVRMKSCALVSVNGGWNLLISAQTRSGAWEPLEVPDDCRTVYDEAAKDACFGRVARRSIAQDPVAFLAHVPAKWSVTFDYFGAAPFYLHRSNPARFDARTKVVTGALETVAHRLSLLLACGLWSRRRVGARPVSRVLTALGALASLLPFAGAGALAHGALMTGALFGLGRRPGTLSPGPRPRRADWVVVASLVPLAFLFAVHGVFFGAGRYGLMAIPCVLTLGAAAWGRAIARR